MTYHPWIICSIGIFFCISGIYFFFKNAFEENKTVKWAVLIMLMGVVLITIASSKLILPAH